MHFAAVFEATTAVQVHRVFAWAVGAYHRYVALALVVQLPHIRGLVRQGQRDSHSWIHVRTLPLCVHLVQNLVFEWEKSLAQPLLLVHQVCVVVFRLRFLEFDEQLFLDVGVGEHLVVDLRYLGEEPVRASG